MDILAGITSSISKRKTCHNHTTSRINIDDIEINEHRLQRLLDAVDTLHIINPTSSDGIVLARLHLAEHIADIYNGIGGSDSESVSTALECTAGLEGEVFAGLEVWSSIVQALKDMLDWLVRQWNNFTEYLKEKINKYTGTAERQLTAWENIKEDISKRRDGYAMKRGSKHKFDSAAGWFIANDVILKPKDLASAVTSWSERYRSLVDNMPDADALSGLSDDLISSVEIVTNDAFPDIKGTKAEINLHGISNALSVELPKATEMTAVSSVPDNVVPKYKNVQWSSKEVYLGNHLVLVCFKPDTDSILSRARSIAIGFSKLTTAKFNPVTMELAELDDLLELTNAHIELNKTHIEILRGSEFKKCQKTLAELVKSLEGSKKDIPSTVQSDTDKKLYRTTVAAAVELVSLTRRSTLGMIDNYADATTKLVAAHIDYAKRTISAYEKD